jgi:hypothetical protein
MGLFKSIGNFFKSGVGKLVSTFGAIVAAPFTAGASLAAIPFLLKGSGSKKDGQPISILEKITQPIKTDNPILPPPIIEPVLEIQPEKTIVTQDEQIEVRKITTPQKTDVTLYGFYSTINKITIPVDNDLENVIVVPNTFFPYIVEFENHPPSEGIRYISEFVYGRLQVEWGSNLGKLLYTLDKELSVYPYLKFNWQTFVDKYNTFNAGSLEKDGGILYGFTISPVFLLQWIDGPEVSPMLDYSYVIPPSVKTVDDLNPTQPEQPPVIKGNITTDPKRFDKLTQIIDSVTKVGATFAIAKAALGGVKSIYKNTKDAIKGVTDAANKLGDKFKDLKTALSKDAINGKISEVKNLIKTKLPTPKNLRKMFLEVKGEFLAGLDPIRKKRLERKKQRREAKDKKIKRKFSLKNFSLPDLPEIPNLPSIPTLPKQINLNNLNQLPGFGKLPNVGGLITQGKGIVSGVGNINFKDPLSLLNAPANILNQAANLANSTADTVGGISQNILEPTLKAKSVAEEAQQKRDADLQKIREDALKTLAANRPTLPTPNPLVNRTGTIQVGNTTTFGSNG